MKARVGAAKVTEADLSKVDYEPDPRKNHEVETTTYQPIVIRVEKQNKTGNCISIYASSNTQTGKDGQNITHRVGCVQFTIKEIEDILKALIANGMPPALPGLSEIKEAQRLLEKAVGEMGAGEQ